MKESSLLNMTFNNVVFATRNKEYGAYQLRLNYNRHVVAAAIVATSIFGLSLAWPLLLPKEEVAKVDSGVKEEKHTTVLLDKTILPPPRPQQEQPLQEQSTPVDKQIKTVRNVTTRVVPDSHKATEVPPTQKEMEGAIIGTQNIKGEALTEIDLSGLETGSGGIGAGSSTSEASTIFDFAEEMPSFQGGEIALMKYISKKMRYPKQAVDERIEGTVIVSFIVDRSGRVTDVTVLKGLGYGADEEAMRVIGNMPAWSPGKQNGKPVAVRYTLPIRFSLQR